MSFVKRREKSSTAAGNVAAVTLSLIIISVIVMGLVLPVILVVQEPTDRASETDNWVPPVNPSGFEHTTLSGAETPLERMCAPSTTSQSFDNARDISNAIFQQSPAEETPDHRRLSALCFLWGQFLDHDVVLSRTNASAPLITIHVDGDDPFFPDPIENITMRDQLKDTETGTPLNFQTPYIDGSVIYGYNLTRLNTKLRAMQDGLMIVDVEGNLPIDQYGMFISGDERVNEHIGLTAMHTLWVREHNRLARELKRDWHPTWTDEQLFWKARQLVIAKMQHITMQEWLPALTGRPTQETEFDILLANDGLQLDVEWTAAVFRIGHSMVPYQFMLDGEPFMILPEMFFNATFFRTLGMADVLQSHAETPNQKTDDKVVHALRNILFRMSGHDLVAFNIERGRILHLPSYREYMQCISKSIPAGTPNTEDKDLYVGVLQEPLPSDQLSSLPPTAAYVFEHQLNKMRTGDPNWYEWPTQRAAIGPHYYPLIEQTTLARVMHLNNVTLSEGHNEVFFLP